MLTTTSTESAAVQGIPQHEENRLEKVLKENLPPLPGSVFRILELMRDPNTSSAQLGEAVGHDPMLAARMLRLANSSYYSRQKNVTSLSKAIDTIGMKALYDALMLGVAANAFSKEIGTGIGAAIWRHSLAVALVAREVSQQADMRGGENAFICGLLHDIGKFVFLKADPKGFKAISERASESEFSELEARHFGVDHSEIGALLVRRWNLPEAISSVILHHHHPENSPMALYVSHVVNAANDIANMNGFDVLPSKKEELFPEIENPFVPTRSMIALHLSREQIRVIWEKVEPHLHEVLNAFSKSK
ncbi:MAG: HDOD domain-containing protein [Pyrinomonadaceae bacterium]|nr:HDOD domain-containing protein [Pyrinomonadaceae bacterium]